jgi:hypothetical protein
VSYYANQNGVMVPVASRACGGCYGGFAGLGGCKCNGLGCGGGSGCNCSCGNNCGASCGQRPGMGPGVGQLDLSTVFTNDDGSVNWPVVGLAGVGVYFVVKWIGEGGRHVKARSKELARRYSRR